MLCLFALMPAASAREETVGWPASMLIKLPDQLGATDMLFSLFQ